MEKIKVIYLMGTGRSGTTALATILGNNSQILTVGEVNQFYEKKIDKEVDSGSFWNKIYKKFAKGDYTKEDELIYKLERHTMGLQYVFGCLPKKLDRYHYCQNKMFEAINEVNPHTFYLDSSKYVARALLLNKNKNIDLKIINIVRDPRGLIWSFNKKVQTSNTPLRTIVYYYAINILSILAKKFCLDSNNVLTIKYEDLVNLPEITFNKLSDFLNIDLNELKSNISNRQPFKVPDIIGGNRLKEKKEIILEPDLEWVKNMSRFKQNMFYLLTWPINLFNKYNI